MTALSSTGSMSPANAAVVGSGNGRARINPARQASLREHNLGIVLAEIVHSPAPPSRADIAAITGLTRTTVSALADQLIAAGLAAELPIVHSRKAGRPAAPLVPARRTLAAVGLEVNVDYLGIRAIDLSGAVLVEHVRAGDFRQTPAEQVLAELADLYAEFIPALVATGIPLAGACLALPGLVDTGIGPLRLAPNLHWQEVDITGILANQPILDGVHITLANEATLAASAEAESLRHTEISSFFYVSGEIGIGGAIVNAGVISAGSHGWSGEIGHTLVDPAGPQCGCGATGCLEQYAGKDALLRRAGLDLNLPATSLAEQAALGHHAALESLREAGSALGIALANTVNLIDVDTVVLGGIYAPLAPHLLPAITAQLQMRVLSFPWAPVQVQPARARDYAALTGAGLTVLGALMADPTSWVARATG